MKKHPGQEFSQAWRCAPLVATLLLALAGCGVGTTTVVGQPTPTGQPSTSTVYIQGGALRASDGAVRWSADLGAEPPLMAGGVAYVLGSASSGQSTEASVTALRLTDGTKLWASTLPVDDSPGPEVLTGDGLLVVATGQYGTGLGMSLRLVALRVADGSLAWQSAPVAVVRRPTVDTPVPFVSRLISGGGRVVAFADSGPHSAFAAAWNAADGSPAWQLPLSGASQYAGASTDLTSAGGVPMAAYYDTSGLAVGALDVARGAWAWSRTLAGAGLDLVVPSALIFSDGETVSALRPTDGTTLWTHRLDGGLSHTLREVAASDTSVFYGDFVACPGATTTSSSDLQVLACQRISALSLTDGALLWQYQLPLDPIYNATYTAYGGGILYYQWFTGSQATGMRVTLLALGAARGGRLWSRATSGLFEALAADAGGVYGIAAGQSGACPTALAAYSARDGAPLWQVPYTPCPHGFIGGLSRLPWLVVG
jgi:outer membrane protein assembly factor BamB